MSVVEVTHEWVVHDPAGLFKSVPAWAAPLQPVSERMEPAQVERASARFAEAWERQANPSGGLAFTALFAHGIR